MLLLAKSRLNSVEILISKVLINSNISHIEFVLIKNVLKEYGEMNEEIKYSKTSWDHRRFQSILKAMLRCYLKCRKNTESKNPKFVRTQNAKIIFLSKCEPFDSKKSKSMKEHKASGLLSSLDIKTFSCKISLLGPLLF